MVAVMATIQIYRVDKSFSRLLIKSCEYDDYPEFESRAPHVVAGIPPPTGTLLDKERGFSFRMERPRISYKVYRALVNGDMKGDADAVINNMRRSLITPDAVWDGALLYLEGTAPRFNSPTLAAAIERVRHDFKVWEKVPLTSISVAAASLPRNTSPGLPYIQSHPGWKKGDIIDKYLPAFSGYWRRVGDGLPTVPLPDCAAFARSHIGDTTTNKVRPVWAYPISAVCAEGIFADSIIKGLTSQCFGHGTAYGCEMMKGGMEWINNSLGKCRLKDPGCKFFMSDFSSFDTTIPAWLIRIAFSIVKEKLDFSQIITDVSGNTEDADSSHYERIFSRIVRYFINTPIRNSDGRRLQKDHGVPSGSKFTNLIDTICNLIIQYCLVIDVFGSRDMFTNAFGDDGLTVLPHDAVINIDAAAEYCLKNFGVILNPKKSYWTNVLRNVKYLGYFNVLGNPFKPTRGLLASMLFPQYLRDDWAYCLSRALGCLFAAAGANAKIFHAVRCVYRFASSHEVAVAGAFDMINGDARARRHLEMMGVDDVKMNNLYFLDQRYSLPFPNCKKIQLGIDMVQETLEYHDGNRVALPYLYDVF